MNLAILNVNTKVVTMSSLEMADLAEKRHDNVRRVIWALVEQGVISHPQIEFGPQSANGVAEKVLLVGKRDSYIVMAQLSPEFTARLVDRWQELEAKQSTPVELSRMDILTLAIESERGRLAAVEQLAIAAPKVAFVDSYVDSTGLKGFREAAKLLKANEGRLREFLTDKKVMYRLGTDWMAYQQHIDAGRFSVKTGTNPRNKHSFSRSLFTSKGIEWLAGLWAVHGLNGGAA